MSGTALAVLRSSLLTALALAALALAAPAHAGAGSAPAATSASVAGGAPAAAAAPPALADRLAWSAWERTRTGIRRLGNGDAAGAATAFDTALRLRADDPRTAYNAGTGRLGAGRPDAVAPLEQAALAAGPELAPDVWYNLGNARLATGDARGAVQAYVETLRRAGERQDAKRNLELALRELDRQERQRRQQEEQRRRQERGAQGQPQPGGSGERQDTQPQSGEPLPAAPPQSAERPQDGRDQPQPSPASRADAKSAAAAGRSARLPDFQNQPDLDAEQAAALLQAVENLERQQRRERALERARARRSEDEDW